MVIMKDDQVEHVSNLVAGQDMPAAGGRTFTKVSPADGRPLYTVARSDKADVEAAVAAARAAQSSWADTPAVRRGLILHDIVKGLETERESMARMVARETGKSPKEALGETGAAIQQGLFFASEGQRLYGRTTTSAVPNKFAMTVRRPIGVAGLIVAANTPIANVAWKVFPALICGNAAVLKAAEDTPGTAWLFGRIAREAGLPDGVFNIVQGFGPEAGAPLVEHPDVGVVSFTGSSAVGREIARRCRRANGTRVPGAGRQESTGGVRRRRSRRGRGVDRAVGVQQRRPAVRLGGRGSSCSTKCTTIPRHADREDERAESRGRTTATTSGRSSTRLSSRAWSQAVQEAGGRAARILAGGGRLDDPARARRVLHGADADRGRGPADDPISASELFGPIACLYRVRDFSEAVALANDSPYGLTACIHTRELNRAFEFTKRVQAGVAVINGGTYGSEPHMPFGGAKLSGNGTREPGTEALDVYSELKDVYFMNDPGAV